MIGRTELALSWVGALKWIYLSRLLRLVTGLEFL